MPASQGGANALLVGRLNLLPHGFRCAIPPDKYSVRAPSRLWPRPWRNRLKRAWYTCQFRAPNGYRGNPCARRFAKTWQVCQFLLFSALPALRLLPPLPVSPYNRFVERIDPNRQQFMVDSEPNLDDRLVEPLTRREREILAYLDQGLSAPEIAERLTLAV